MKRFWMSVGGLLTLLVLFLAFNLLVGAGLRTGRIDLTENRLYTLSDGTRNILARLQEPVTLRFYFSRKLSKSAPGLVTYADRVQELLEEYASRSAGKLRLEIEDPIPFTEAEDRAVAYGLQGVPATAAGEKFYFGLAGTNTTDGLEVIPFFQQEREEFLEYDLTRLVHNLSNPERGVVGILTALPLDGNPMARFQNPNAPNQAWYVVESLRQLFDVRMIAPNVETLEPDLDVLLVVHPQSLAPRTLFAIDQFVLGGGKLIACVDPYCEVQEVPSDPQNPLSAMMADRSSGLEPLLSAWGIELVPEQIAGDKELALRVGYQGQGVDYVVWMGLKPASGALNRDDVVTSQLDNLHVATAGVLRKKDGATTSVTPLLETSTSSMRIQKSAIQFGPDPNNLLATFQSGGERLLLGARVAGPVRTAYPEGRPAAAANGAEESTPPPAEVLAESKGPIQVIVLADVDFLADRMWVREQNFLGQRLAIPQADNGTFLVNAVDNMTGSADLISLRSRGRSIRPFDKVVELRRAAETRFRQEEQDLEAKLKDAEQRINELQGSKDQQSALILSPEQEAEIERFRAERDRTRRELRAVRADLNRDIESLKWSLVWLNSFAVPALVAVAGVLIWVLRRKRMVEARTGGAGG
jgi:ABC-type uncharacterized transport system involved in gliding motility auxiliary subunit